MLKNKLPLLMSALMLIVVSVAATGLIYSSFSTATEANPQRNCIEVTTGKIVEVKEGDCVRFAAQTTEPAYYAIGLYGGSLMLMSEKIGMAMEPSDIQLFASNEPAISLDVVLKRTAGTGQTSYVYLVRYESWMEIYQNYVTSSQGPAGVSVFNNAAGLACDERTGLENPPYCGN